MTEYTFVTVRGSVKVYVQSSLLECSPLGAAMTSRFSDKLSLFNHESLQNCDSGPQSVLSFWERK